MTLNDNSKLKIPQLKNEKYPLHYACRTENVELVKQLVSLEEIDINLLSLKETKYKFELERNTALNIAVEKENSEIVKLLLSNDKIDVNIKSKNFTTGTSEEKTALNISVEKENVQIIALLLKNKNRNTATKEKRQHYI